MKRTLVTCGAVATALLLWTHGAPSEEPAAPSGAGAQGDDAALAARLEALGYVAPVLENPDPHRVGVTRHDAERASPGVNVYCSVRSPDVHLIDMAGRELHSLTLPSPGAGQDCMVKPDGAGGFVALAAPTLTRLAFDSAVSWTSDAQHHHDFAVLPSGHVFVLSERPGTLEVRGAAVPIRDHAVVLLDRRGLPVHEVGLFEPFAPLIPEPYLRRARAGFDTWQARGAGLPWAFDVFHPNTLEILPRFVPGLGRAGDVLLCLRELDLIAVVDLVGRKVRWSFGQGVLDRPHHPSLLPNGHVVVLDNGPRRGHSRVVEVDPRARKIVWEYRADPPEAFYTPARGGVQHLPNDNLLITESTRGRVFEITRAGEIVWEFWNPGTVPETGERQQIYRMQRLAPAEWESLRAAARPAAGGRPSGQSAHGRGGAGRP